MKRWECQRGLGRLGQEPKLDAAVFGAARGGGVVGDRLVGTKTHCGQACSVDAFVDEVLTNGIGALLRQGSVGFGRAGVVGVPSDFDTHRRMLF